MYIKKAQRSKVVQPHTTTLFEHVRLRFQVKSETLTIIGQGFDFDDVINSVAGKNATAENCTADWLLYA